MRTFSLLLALLCFSPTKPIHAADNTAAFSGALSKKQQFEHALERLTFGPRRGDFERIEKLGLRKWLNAQLHPERIPESPSLLARLAPLESLGMEPREMYERYPLPRMIADLDSGAKIGLAELLTQEQIATLKRGSPDEQRRVLESVPPAKVHDLASALTRQQQRQLALVAPTAMRRQFMLMSNPRVVVSADLCEAKILRAVYGEHQLQELLADFWFNHFNVYVDKGADRYLVTSYERDAIRPHVFSRFYDLLLATAKSPAMLFYLDNWQSVAPNEAPTRAGKKGKRGLNENYGRELLELHTLGVDGGYTQQDVIEVARCFTGWTIAGPRKGGDFEYNDRVHDHGQKVVLGHVIAAGGGMSDGLKVLEILAKQPATARFVSLRLAQRFVADDPPPSLIDRMVRAFLKSDGDLRKVTETMIKSREFWSAGSYRAKLKTPFEMVVSAVRGIGADVTSAFLLNNQIQRLGEPLYRKVEPNGYPLLNADWLSSASLVGRMNFALALAHNRLPGVKVDYQTWQSVVGEDPLELARTLLEEEPSEPTKAAIAKSLGADTRPEDTPSIVAGLTLGSPEFQRR